MDNYSEKLQAVIDDLDLFSAPQDRIDFLIQYAENYKEVPSSIADRPYPAENKVDYCESLAYVWSVPKDDGTFDFHFAVENPQGISAKALASILQETLSGEQASSILKIPEDIVLKIFGQNLSMGKNLGLTNIFVKIKKDLISYYKNNE